MCGGLIYNNQNINCNLIELNLMQTLLYGEACKHNMVLINILYRTAIHCGPKDPSWISRGVIAQCGLKVQRSKLTCGRFYINK